MAKDSLTWKVAILYLSKVAGLFCISKKLTRKGLRILCYHNFGEGDEVVWKPKLFITPDTFAKRLRYLQKNKFNVIPLNAAVGLMRENHLPNFPVVITIDDGWSGVAKYAHGLLRHNSFPYTVYVTSYYVLINKPVFNLLVQYIFRQSQKISVDLTELGIPGLNQIRLDDGDIASEFCGKFIKFCDLLDFSERFQKANRLCDILGVNYQKIMDSRIFDLMTTDEIKLLESDGVDFQLHSHRHRWPLEEEMALKEIEDNRCFLTKVVDAELEHFCYPSGFWRKEQFDYLKRSNIKSATTCEPGLNYPGADPYALNRFLDGENIPQIVFEAEMSGFLDLLRCLKRSAREIKQS